MADHPLPVPALARVLLVEDDAVLSLLLEDALLHGGAGEVVICATMQAALNALESGFGGNERPTAMILDVHLADRHDGWALAELATLLGPRPPRIVFSTGSPGDIPEAVAALGPVFEKPYDAEELVKALIGKTPRGLLDRLRHPLG
jgi:CheY-like chemotaxis protein